MKCILFKLFKWKRYFHVSYLASSNGINQVNGFIQLEVVGGYPNGKELRDFIYSKNSELKLHQITPNWIGEISKKEYEIYTKIQ